MVLANASVYVLVMLTSMVAGPFQSAGQQLSKELQPLSYRLGTWTAAVEWLDADGKVTRVVPSIMEVTPVLGGHGLEQRGRLVGTPTEVIAILFVDADSKQITEIGISASGRLDVLHPTFETDRVIFTAEPTQRGDTTVIFRAIDEAFEPDRYRTTGWISADGGTTWRQTFRQINHRIERAPARFAVHLRGTGSRPSISR